MSAQPVISATQWRERAATLKLRSGVFIDGRFVPAANGATFDNINPATGRSLGTVAAGEQLDVDRAVASARAAFRRGSWSQAAPKVRKRVLLQVCRAPAGEQGRAGAAGNSRHGQAHRRQPERRHPVGRELHSLVRRSGGQDL